MHFFSALTAASSLLILTSATYIPANLPDGFYSYTQVNGTIIGPTLITGANTNNVEIPTGQLYSLYLDCKYNSFDVSESKKAIAAAEEFCNVETNQIPGKTYYT
ncbi:hypothetical protein G7Y89_g10709 [Cudoniella acicularis]|uniref:Uncharacterized protein n=1 Tax=Cudoniella acicularis TaxID=354080 RepID=A0A8H4VYR6_9HELO|nr:hypothetical protein G7Y89_g10709 [Cudoniella acicularis]